MCFGVYIAYVYSRYSLCLLLQILLTAALDIKTRDVPTVSSINSFLSQYCKASLYYFFIFCKFLCRVGVPTVRFAPVFPWAKAGPAYTLPEMTYFYYCTWKNTEHLASRTELYGYRDRARPVPVSLCLGGRCKA
jgi:hypothetical protein